MTVATADRLAIQALVTRYNRAVDRGDVERWVACFTADGVFDGIPGRFEGAAALRGFAEDLARGPAGEPFRPMRHWTTNFVFEAGGRPGPDGLHTEARMRSDHLLFRQRGGTGELLVFAEYRDRLRRGADGEWRFAERVVVPLGKQGV